MIPPLYAIADRESLDRRVLPIAPFVEELRDAGVTLLQYRDKRNGPQEILRTAREVAEVFGGTAAHLVMNDRADLASILRWGVHVGQGDLPVTAVRSVLAALEKRKEGCSPQDATALVGVSTHDEAQVGWADRSLADYVAIGPVFATGSKANPEPVVGLEGVRRARALTKKPLVAIGGITLENARSVQVAGADSVAVIGGLFVPGRAVREVAEDFLARLR